MGSSTCGLPTTKDCLLTKLIQATQAIPVPVCAICQKSRADIEGELKQISAEFTSEGESRRDIHANISAGVGVSLNSQSTMGECGKLPRGHNRFHPDFIGRYEVLCTLGHGGMGVVYRVRDRESLQEYALKTLPDMGRAGSQTKARFQREIASVRQLNHPSLVQYVDSNVTEEISYLVMPVIHGIDIGTLLSGGKSLPLADVSEIVRQTAIGLSAAHEQMIIHRDVKPSNLMLTLTEFGQVRVKILDFGVAINRGMQIESTLTEEGQMLGTLDYMSAEQLSDSHLVDCSSDIYSLGATAFRLLAGVTPFQKAGRSPLQIIMAIRESSAPDIRSLCPDLPLSIAGFLNGMLDREPCYRPRSMRDVAIAFESYATAHQLRERLEGVLSTRANAAGATAE